MAEAVAQITRGEIDTRQRRALRAHDDLRRLDGPLGLFAAITVLITMMIWKKRRVDMYSSLHGADRLCLTMSAG